VAKGMSGPWKPTGDTLKKLGSPALWHEAKRRAVLKECHRLRGIMVLSFNKGGPPGRKWKALSTFTQLVGRMKGKGDRHPLLDTGDLRNSHSVVEEDNDTFFVGIHRTAKSKKKGGSFSMVNLGLIHEHGTKPIYIRITPKMRWWWRNVLVPGTKGQIRPLKNTTIAIVVRIPARPWIGPIWDMEKDRSATNVMNDTVKNLGIPGLTGMMR
jgi:hypothetical protein